MATLLTAFDKFVWSAQYQLDFDNVKTLLCGASVLVELCLNEPFKLEVNASHVGRCSFVKRMGGC